MAIPKGCKRSLEAARQACLYGEGDGKPVMNVKRLMALGQASEKTILKHLPSWQQEREELAANSSGQSLALNLSAKELHLHESDMKTLRSEINQIKWELENLDDSIQKLEALTEKLCDAANGDIEVVAQATSIFSKYLNASLNKQNLRKQFLALQKQWTGLSGIEGLMDVALVREREMEKGRVKIALKKEGSEAEPRNVGPTGNAVFVRRNTQEAISLDPVRSDEDAD